MRIPNKFNGYSADNRRIYNDPATVTIAIANMGQGVSIANALAASAAAASAAAAAGTTAATTQAGTTAATTQAGTTAGTTAAQQAAVQQAGQAGIMSGGTSTGASAGVPGLGAPVTPATPLPPAGGTPFTPPTPAGSTPPPPPPPPSPPPVADEIAYANANQFNALPPEASPALDPVASPWSGVPPTSPPPGLPNLPWSGGPPTDAGSGIKTLTDVAKPVVDKPSFLGDNAFSNGIRQAADLVGKGYRELQQAPMSVQALTTLGAGKAYQKFFGPESPGEEKYKDMDMSGFSPSEPIQQPFQRSYDWQGYAVGGPVEEMSAMNAVGANANYPQADLQTAMYSNPMIQRPQANNVINQGLDVNVDPYTGQERFAKGGIASGSTYDADKEAAEAAAQRKRYSQMMGDRSSDIEADIAQGQAIASKARGSGVGIVPFERTNKSPHAAAIDRYQHLAKKVKVPGIKMPKTNLGNISDYTDTMGSGPIEAARGGIMHGLGGYSDGGRLLKGPGDGVSDSIPAVIGNRQPARLADGEFVVPARIVSELGNGSTEAGARKLYAMMERVQKQRGKTVGKNKVAVNSKAAKHLPA
jgi:hypothetical protein